MQLNPLFLGLIIWNSFVFLLYTLDKIKAKFSSWRIPEKYLLMTSLLGGGIGALLAMYICRHKTQKPLFLATSLLSILILIGLLGYLTSKSSLG